MLGNGDTEAGEDQACSGGNVVGAREIAAGAARIEGPFGGVNHQRLGPHGHGAAGDLIDRLATEAQAHEESPHLRLGGFTGHHDVERFLRAGQGEALAFRHLGENTLKGVAHVRTGYRINALFFNELYGFLKMFFGAAQSRKAGRHGGVKLRQYICPPTLTFQ